MNFSIHYIVARICFAATAQRGVVNLATPTICYSENRLHMVQVAMSVA